MDIADQAYDLSVRLAEIVRYLKEDGQTFPLGDKLLESGIAAGLSAREGCWPTCAREVAQADYILEMAVRSGYLTTRQSLPVRTQCAELLAALPHENKSGPKQAQSSPSGL